MRLDLSGINPAHLVPFEESSQEIHEEGLRNHLRQLVEVDGVNGLVCNGHAAEVHALTQEERERIVRINAEVADESTPVISGIVGGSTREVVDDAQRAQQAGADALLALPPYTQIRGRDEAALTFFRTLGSEVDIPIVLFQHPVWAGGAYSPELLADLAQLDHIVAVKEAIWDIDRFQQDVRALRRNTTDVQILVADDEHLLPCYSFAGDGSILGMAAAIPELVVDLFEAVQGNDLEKARSVYDRMIPFVDAVYGSEPKMEAHTRLKVALEIQGALPTSVPRAPALPLEDEERDEIRSAMEVSQLL